MYALGYMFNPSPEPGIFKSGLIYISTAPPGADVYLGNRRYARKTPTMIPDLLPGNYNLRLVLKKHTAWSNDVPIEAGKATVLERVLLFRENLKTKELELQKFDEITPIPNSRYVILSKSELAADFYLYDLKLEKLKSIFPLHSSFRDMKVLSAITVEKSAAFLLHLDSSKGEKFIWVEPRRTELKIKNVSNLISSSPDHVQWDPDDKNRIYLFHDNSIDIVNLTTKAAQARLIDQVQGFGLFNRKLFVLKSDYTFAKYDHDGKFEKNLFQDPALGQILFGEHFFKVEVFPDDLIIFLNEDGRLITNRMPYQFAEKGILDYEYDPKSERLLVWKEDSIGIIDFSKGKDEDVAFEFHPKLTWIFKGEKIKQAYWVYEASHVLFLTNNKVFLLELETYGRPNLKELIEVKPKSSISYSEDLGNLYYLSKESGRLSYLEVLPRTEIILLPFPERKEEKKKLQIGSYELLV